MKTDFYFQLSDNLDEYLYEYIKYYWHDNSLISSIEDGKIYFKDNEDLVLFKLLYLDDFFNITYDLNNIKNPSEKLKYAAIKFNIANIFHFDNPSEEELKKFAVKLNPTAILFLNEPSEELQEMAVRDAGHIISYIKNPTEKAKILAVKNNPYAIVLIQNPSFKLKLIALFTKFRIGFTGS
jgi:hypothetical protein